MKREQIDTFFWRLKDIRERAVFSFVRRQPFFPPASTRPFFFGSRTEQGAITKP